MKLVLNKNNIKNKIRLSLISLGCEKNLMDSELILGLIDKNKNEFLIEPDVEKADCVIINTCGFINSAKEEALDTIFDCINIKQEKIEQGLDYKVIVCGCLTERYYNDLSVNEDLKDVDLWIQIKDYFKFGEMINDLFKERINNPCLKSLNTLNRVISTGNALAYIRISEGCNNRCTYCAIPLIRGNFVSRSHEDIVREFKELVNKGYYEICLISQDLSNYGYDCNDSLANLIRDLDKVEGNYVIRLLYLYPDEITLDFIKAVKESKHVLHYFDIPLQHASDKMLELMHRRGKKEDVKKLINKIREEMNDAIIRTTMIVGFPKETDSDFEELLEFVREMKFNHLGAFTYSKEEDTISYDYDGQIEENVKTDRYNKLMEEQKWVSLKRNNEFVGKKMWCLIEDYDDEEDVYSARSYIQAPDDIDGALYVSSDKVLEIGKVYEVEITEADFYDMKGIIK